MIGNDPVECTSGQNGCCATAFSPQVALKAGWVKCKSKRFGEQWRCNDCNYVITTDMPSIQLHGSDKVDATRARGNAGRKKEGV